MDTRANMNVGTAHSEVNPNTRVMNSRGIWLSYVLGIGLLHVVLLSIPFFSVPVVWTLTNIIHNMVREWCGWLDLQGREMSSLSTSSSFESHLGRFLFKQFLSVSKDAV